MSLGEVSGAWLKFVQANKMSEPFLLLKSEQGDSPGGSPGALTFVSPDTYCQVSSTLSLGQEILVKKKKK